MTKEYVTAAFQNLTHCGESFPINENDTRICTPLGGSSKHACHLNFAYFKLFSFSHSLVSSVDYHHRDTGASLSQPIQKSGERKSPVSYRVIN